MCCGSQSYAQSFTPMHISVTAGASLASTFLPSKIRVTLFCYFALSQLLDTLLPNSASILLPDIYVANKRTNLYPKNLQSNNKKGDRKQQMEAGWHVA